MLLTLPCSNDSANVWEGWRITILYVFSTLVSWRDPCSIMTSLMINSKAYLTRTVGPRPPTLFGHAHSPNPRGLGMLLLKSEVCRVDGFNWRDTMRYFGGFVYDWTCTAKTVRLCSFSVVDKPLNVHDNSACKSFW